MRIATFTLPDDVERERHLTVESEPGRIGGLLMLGPLALMFALMGLCGLGLLWVAGDDVGAVLFGLLLIGSGTGAVAMIWRHWRRAPMPWMRVSPEGLASAHVPGLPQALLWRDVGGAGAAQGCVGWALERESTQRQIKVPLRKGGHVLLSLSFPSTMRCPRFRNSRALKRALLLQLAAIDRPRLRFDPEVFVDARLSPRTWAPMRRPTWLRALLMGGTLFVVGYVIFLRLDASWWWTLGACMGVMLAGVAVMSWGQWVHFPDLRDTIEFDLPSGIGT